MKKYASIINVFMVFALVSCDKWLDVKPKLEIYEETLFEKAGGYYSALNGLYVKMSAQELYGKELTWGAMEAWGGSYDLSDLNHRTYYQLFSLKYDQNEVKNLASSFWLKSYEIIAEANNLIQNLNADSKVKFPYGDTTKNMILGEAYAVRAMLHFDLVRIFAQAPVVDGGTSAFVPYVTAYPSKINPPMPTNEVLQYIIADLEKAKDLVKAFDRNAEMPGTQSFRSGLVEDRLKLDNGMKSWTQVDNEFFKYRANRLGYFPITQLLARVCLYAGEYDKAYENADEIITVVFNGTIYNFIDPFYIGDPTELDMVEPRFHSEILFGVYNSFLPDWTKKCFESVSGSGRLLLNDKYGTFSTSQMDCRYKAIIGDMPTKFSLTGKDQKMMDAAKCIVPLMRFLECYYIAAECIFDHDKKIAIGLMNNVFESRGNYGMMIWDSNITKEDFMEEIVREYRREFLCEGQMIFVYKRLNLPIRRAYGEYIEHGGKLVLPVPDNEAGI